jgi:cytochrome c551
VRRLATLAALALGLALAGCGGDDGDEANPPPPPPPAASSEETGGEVSGEAVFASAGCGGCHTFTPAGSSGTVGPNLDEISLSAADVEQQVRNGGGGMPSFEGDLSDVEIAAVAEYVSSGGG